MRGKEYRLFQSACRQAAQTYPQLQRIQRETVEQSAASIKDEVESFLGAVFRDREQIRKAAARNMQPLLAVFDLGLLQVCDLSHFAWQNLDSRMRLIWPDATLPSRPSPTRVFYLLNQTQ